MSVIVMTAVFKHSASKGAARLVLLALADVASDEGEVTAYPRGQAILGRKANVNAVTVRRSIEALVALGEVEVLVAGTGRRSSDYRIKLPDLDNFEGVQDAPPARAGRAPRGSEVNPQGVQDAPPISTSLSVLGPSPTPTALPLTVADPFDAFWSEYPRRVEKIKARKTWTAQIKRKVDPRDLIAAAENYAEAKRGTPTDKIKHPATFLGPDDVWRDWLDGGAALAEAEQGEVYVSDEPIYS